MAVTSWLVSILLLVAIFEVSQCSTVATTSCTEESINACYLPIDTYLGTTQDTTVANVSSEGVALSGLDRDQMTEFCRIWDLSTGPCFQGLMVNCDDASRTEFVGFEESLQFLCDSLDRYVMFKNCTSTQTVQNMLLRCEYTFYMAYEDAHYDWDSNYNKAICDAVGTLISCDAKVVQSHCGVEAADWFKEYEELYHLPYYDHMHGCRDTGFCSYQNIESCWDSVNTYLSGVGTAGIQQQSFDYMFHNLTTVQLSQFCQLYTSQTSPCLVQLNATCEDYERKTYEGQESSLDFLCNQGMEEFATHRLCLNSNGVANGIVHCFEQFVEDLDEAYMQTTVDDIEKSYCSAIKSVVQCDKKVVHENCGRTAGEWMEEYETRQLTPYLDGVNCGTDAPAMKCTESSISSCWEPVDTYAQTIGFAKSHDDFALYLITDDQVREYCRIYTLQVSECLLGIRPYCSLEDRKLFEGEEDSLDYLCSQALEQYLISKACIGSDATQAGIAVCTRTFYSQLNNANADTVAKRNKQYCDAVHESVACDTNAVTQQCGQDAGNWVQEYQTRYLEPYLDHVGCPFSGSKGLSAGQKAGIAIFVLLGIGAIVVALIIGWHCYTKKKAEAAKDRQRLQFDNPLSAGGGGPAQPGADSAYAAAGVASIGAYENPELQKTPPTDQEFGITIDDDPYINLQRQQPAGPPVANGSAQAHNPLYSVSGGVAGEGQYSTLSKDVLSSEPQYATMDVNGDLSSSNT